MESTARSRRELIKLSLGAAGAGMLLPNAVRASEPTANWPSWRGPSRDGVVGSQGLPSDLGSLKQTWSKKLSDSYSGPIVSEGKVFTTETVDRRDETLIAYDVASGEQIWKRQWAGAMTVPFFAKANGDWIRSTPATDGKTIVVGGMRDVVAAFDAKTGEEKWRIDFIKDHGATLPSFGLVCSPLIDGDFVYVQAGGAVRKIALEDGSLVWGEMKDQGGMYGGAFSSPMIAELHGVRQLLVQTRTTLGGISMENGKVLWQQDIPAFRGMNILTPTVWGNKVFTSSYGGKGRLLSIEYNGGNWSASTAWECKTEAYMSSPIGVGEHLYIHLRNKRLACLDLKTGQETWRTTPFGDYWSMVTDGNRILALDSSGELRLVAANPQKFELLDSKAVSQEPSWAYLAVVGNQIFVRRQLGLDAYDWTA